VLSPKAVIVGNGEHAETERVSVDNEGLTSQSLLKIQSDPLGNPGDLLGDEMNIFIPQSIQTAIELEYIAEVKNQVITPAISVPIFGIVQDGPIAAYNLTQPTMRVDWKDAMNLISYTSIDDLSSFKKGKDYLGSDIFSMIIPRGVYMENSSVKVEDGQIDPKKSVLDKSSMAPKAGNGIIHNIWDKYGVEKTKNFIDDCQRLLNNFNLLTGFSTGIGDIMIKKELFKKINKFIESKKLEVNCMITETENNPDLMTEELFEQSIYADLNAVRDELSNVIMENVSDDNAIDIMIKSGSKGGKLHMAQMCCSVGQQALQGKRIEKKLNKRALYYFHQNDDSAEARGFISESFLYGLTPANYIFHQMTSREGLISTAIKTAESGYVQRRLIKALEDLMCKYDGTVRTAKDVVVQYIYGDSGVSPTKYFRVKLRIIKMDNNQLKEKHTGNSTELNSLGMDSNLNKKYYEELKHLRDLVRFAQKKGGLTYDMLNDTFNLPVNFNRVINDATHHKSSSNTKLTGKYVLESINKLLKIDVTRLVTINKKNPSKLKAYDDYNAKLMLRLALYEFFGPKIAIKELKLNKEQFDLAINEMRNIYNAAIIEPGEMIGIIAAQSCGEPVTQMTLNVFHHTGIGSKSATGVVRVKEILSCSKTIKTPIMSIYLADEKGLDVNNVNRIASHIKFTTMNHVRDKIDIYYDPEPTKDGSIMIRDGVYSIFHSHNINKNSCQNNISGLPWLLRIQLNKDQMISKEITLLDIKSRFCNFWDHRFTMMKNIKRDEKIVMEKIVQCAILSNNDSSEVPIIHIRFDIHGVDYNVLSNFAYLIVDSFKLKGMSNIEDIGNISAMPYLSYDTNGKIHNDEKENIIYTNGTDLKGIRYINDIDLERTVSNDIVEVYETFGIEAARTILIKQLIDTYKASGGSLTYQHASLLADNICNTGALVTVDRHRLTKVDIDPMARASFEKTVDQFTTAAIFSEKDEMKSVSSRIMCGQVIKGGTGYCNLILDTEAILNSEFTEDNEQKYKKTSNELELDPVMKDALEKDATGVFMPE
jgi:DNA-directed RNA polymerase II subunit RPB1